MDESPLDPESRDAATLKLEAQLHAMRSMIALLVADNPNVFHLLTRYSAVIQEMALNAAVTDQQIAQIRDEFDTVLESVAAVHKVLGIDPRADDDQAQP